MPTLDELADAIILADEQGDTESLATLADAYEEQKAAQAAPRPGILRDTGQGRGSSFFSNVGRGAASIVPNVVGGVGTVVGSDTLKQAGDSLEAGINEMLPVNPLYEDEFTQKAGQAIGQGITTLGTGGAGGFAGKALGGVRAINAGSKVGVIAPGFLAGTRGGGKEAEQFGMTGGTAYARALLGGVTAAGTEYLPFGTGLETGLARRMLGETLESGAGGLVKAGGTEALEEGADRLLGNTANKWMAPEGVETPGYLADVGENMALGGVGGVAMKGITNMLPQGQPGQQPTPVQEGEPVESPTIEGDAMVPFVPTEQVEESVADLKIEDVEDPLLAQAATVAAESVAANVDTLPATAAALEELANDTTETQPEQPLPADETPATVVEEAPALAELPATQEALAEAGIEPIMQDETLTPEGQALALAEPALEETAVVEAPEPVPLAEDVPAVEEAVIEETPAPVVQQESPPELRSVKEIEDFLREGSETQVMFDEAVNRSASLRSEEEAIVEEISKIVAEHDARKRPPRNITFNPKKGTPPEAIARWRELASKYMGAHNRVIEADREVSRLGYQTKESFYDQAKKVSEEAISYALANNMPVSAEAVEELGIAVPEGYVKQGTRLVPSAAPTPQQVAPTPQPVERPRPNQEVTFKREGKVVSGLYRGQDQLGRHVIDVDGATTYVASMPVPAGRASPIKDLLFDANESVESDEVDTGIAVAEANQVVEEFRKLLPKGPPIRVVTGQELLESPEFQVLRETAEQVGAPVDRVGGWFEQSTGTAFLVADQVADSARAREVLIHEVVTHGGIDAIATDAEMRKIANIIRRVAPDLAAGVNRRYPGADLRTKTSELLAKFSETYQSADPANLRAGWQQAWEEIKRILSAILKRLGGDINAFDDLTLHRFYTNAVRRLTTEGVQAEADGAKLSVSPSTDAEYLAAVEAGDTAKAQQMVDAAAKAAGYNVGPVYHGTSDQAVTKLRRGQSKKSDQVQGFPFQVFDTQRQGPLTKQVEMRPGAYFTPNRKYAEGVANYASNFGRNGKPVVGRFYLRDSVERVSEVSTEEEYRAIDPSQIKSADPVTRDDQGNVIPLSERFKPESDDIRFSVESANPENFTGTPEAIAEDERQQAAGVSNAKTSKARFLPWRKKLQNYIPTTIDQFDQDAQAYLGTMSLEEAFKRVMADDVPANLKSNADGRQNFLVANLLQNVFTAMGNTKDPYEVSRLRVMEKDLMQRYNQIGTGVARATGTRGYSNALLAPIAPILQTEKVLIDKAEARTKARFEGGADGATQKVEDINTDASAEASDELANQLSGEDEADTKERGDAEKLRNKAQATAERIFAKLIRPQEEGKPKTPDPVRALYNQHLKTPLSKDAFVKGMTDLEVEQQFAETLFTTAADEIRGREITKKLNDKLRSEAALRRRLAIADSRASQLIYKVEERLRQGSKDLTTNKGGDSINKAFKDQVAKPVPQAEFAARLAKLGVSAEVSGRLFKTAEREAADLKAMEVLEEEAQERRIIEIAENRASRLIYRTEEKLRQGSKDLKPSSKGDTINKAFREQVKSPTDWAVFRDRLAKLDVGEVVAQRLFRTAEREAEDQQAMREFRDLRKFEENRAKIVSKDSPKLSEMLNDLRRKLYPDMNWRDIFEDLPSQQKDRQKEIFTRLRLDERLAGLTTKEAVDLTNELDKAWQRERRKVFLRELQRVGVGGKTKADNQKVEKVLPQLLRSINLGVFNSDMFREAVSTEYGLRKLTAAESQELRKLAEEAWQLPEGIRRNRKMGQLLNSLQKATGSSRVELLNSYWVSAVLSGMATHFDTYMAVLNGFGTNLLQNAAVMARGNPKQAFKNHLQWWEGLNQGVRESLQILAKPLGEGDYSVLKRFTTDLNLALKGDSNFRPVPLGESLWKNGNVWQKYGMAPVMIFTGRLMNAADHINNTATSYGAMAVARALHPEVYEGLGSFTAAEKAAARREAIIEVTGGPEPVGMDQKSEVSVRTREILAGALVPEQQEEASFIGDQAAYQNDPTGFFGTIYSALNSAFGAVERKAEAASEDPEFSNAVTRAALAVLAGGLRGLTGAKFMRFGFNFGNELTQYIPGSILAQKLANVYGSDLSRSRQDLLMGRNIFGLMAAATIAALFLDKDDEDDGWHIEGNWSGMSIEQKKQLRSAGKEPLTMWKRNPDGTVDRISYKSWPTSGVFVSVGSMADQKRYEPAKWKERGLAGNLLRAVTNGALQVQDVTAMRGLAELFGASNLSADPEAAFMEKLAKTPIRYAGGFIPNLLKDLDAWEDPRNFKPETALEELVRNVPIMRKQVAGGRPMLNLLGEPVKLSRQPWRRVYTEFEGGPAYETLGSLLSRGLSLPNPSTRRIVRFDGANQTIESLGPEAEWQFSRILGEKYKSYLEENGAKLKAMTTERAQKTLRTQADRMADAAEKEMVKTLKKP